MNQRIIYKYPIPFGKPLKIQGVSNPKVVAFDFDRNEDICVWVEFDYNTETDYVLELKIVGTGSPFNSDRWEHKVSKVFDNKMVWHVVRKIDD